MAMRSDDTSLSDDPGPWGGGDSGPKQRPPYQPRPRPANSNQPDFEEALKNSWKRTKDFFQPEGRKTSLIILALVISGFIFFSSFYSIDPDEQGVVLRFGKFNRIAEPGLNAKFPSPIEDLVKVKVTRINRVQVGVAGNRGSGEIERPEESLMLTGDENIVDINFEAQWKVSDAKAFLFNVQDPDQTVKSSAESAMREIIGKTPIAFALAEGKAKIEQESEALLKNILNSYNTGIEVVRLQLLKVDPPDAVIDSFRDVQNARTEREKARNEAEAYRNDIIPRARGEAQRITQDAEAYKQRVVAEAQGEASRFSSIYNQYLSGKEVTKRRIYLETMESVLRGVDKVVMEGGQGPVPYMSLPDIARKRKEAE